MVIAEPGLNLGFDERRLAEQKSLDHSTSLKKLASWRTIALLNDTDPDPTPRSTVCCGSTVEAIKQCDLEKKGKMER